MTPGSHISQVSVDLTVSRFNSRKWLSAIETKETVNCIFEHFDQLQ